MKIDLQEKLKGLFSDGFLAGWVSCGVAITVVDKYLYTESSFLLLVLYAFMYMVLKSISKHIYNKTTGNKL